MSDVVVGTSVSVGQEANDEGTSNPGDELWRQRHALEQAFRTQLTAEKRRQTLRYARRRVHELRLNQLGRRVEADDLVHDVLRDLWAGVEPWNPEVMDLVERVFQLIKDRTWDLRHRAPARPHVLIAPTTLYEDETPRLERELIDAHASHGDLSPILLASMTRAIAQRLEPLARAHPGARVVARAWADGHVDRGEVLARTGLSEAQYSRARSVLLSLARGLPDVEKADAREVLRRVS